MAQKKNRTKLPAQKKPRQRKEQSYRHFRLSKKISPSGPALASFFSLLRGSLTFMRANKRLFVVIILIHSVLGLLLVTGLSSTFDFVQTKQDLEDVLGGQVDRVTSTVALLGFLVQSAGNQSGEAGSTYQLFLTLITSLAIIWAIRQRMAGEQVSAKESFYKGLYPLVPFLLVLFVIGIQLLPALIGSSIYSIVLNNGLAVTSIEKVLWLILFLLTLILSLYFILSSLLALYIVTLPEMTPLKALRSARGLVLHRRLAIALRLVAYIVVVLVAGLVIVTPFILLAPWLAIVVFLLYSSFCLCLTHTYIYSLYRGLL